MLQKLKEIKPKEIIEGYFGKFFHGRNMTIAFWNVKKNSKIPKHNHVHEQCLYVKKGSFKLMMDGKTMKVNENEWNELYKLSENTFVEESEEKKLSGAGAGLTDND